MKDKIIQWLGIDKKSPYVRDYFYAVNMRASIYMSLIVVVLEIWMIIRMTRTILGLPPDQVKPFDYYFQKYYLNYIILLTAGSCMLIFALRFIRGKKDNPVIGTVIKWIFSFVCIYFGEIISYNDYAKGEQILTFLTMELFVVCLLIWRPLISFLILSASYLIFYFRIDMIPPPNNPEIGTTLATQINLFTMYLSTLLFSFANYTRTLSQAKKDENLEDLNAHLSRISVEDELTGIHNMVYFRSEAEKMMNYITTDKENIVFLFFDIENFKSYNEKYGFHEGNILLKKIAHLIEEAFEGSLVSRFSDDHFVVLTRFHDCQEKIQQLSHEIKCCQGEVHLELKCGAYKPAETEKDPSLACDRARFACNSIKKHYDCYYQLYDKSLEDRFHLKQYIVNHIDTAIANGYIKVFYQPVVSTENGRVCGLEALARWQDPNYGLLPPGAFIEILEEYRQIYKLDQCIIEQVCRDYCEAQEKHLPFVPVSLNFSRLDFELCDIVGFVSEISEKYHVPHEFLDIEITESALTEQQNLLTNAVRKLRETGFKVWLDDFGSGYSSLNVLKDYQFDVLKIDMKFLSGFPDNTKTQPILTSIVNLTKQLAMVSLTEGVETQEQFEFLRSIGCNRAQGYLFSKPVPLEILRQKIQSEELQITQQYLKN